MESSGGESRPRSWTARVLVWVALAVVVALVFLVASGEIGGLDEDDDADRERPRVETTETDGGCNPPADNAVKVGFYILKPGEPGLSQVEARTCIPVEELTELNPDLDPQAIPVGACINLRPRGCEDAG